MADAQVEETTPSTSSILLSTPTFKTLVTGLIRQLDREDPSTTSTVDPTTSVEIQDQPEDALDVGLAALHTFLQVNVTGPVLPSQNANQIEDVFSTTSAELWGPDSHQQALRKASLKYLEVGGVAPYAHSPYPELFCLAKYIFDSVLSKTAKDASETRFYGSSQMCSLAWMRLRINTWHYKLLTQPSLGPGSNFTRSSQWSEVPTLATRISKQTELARQAILGTEIWATDDTWTTDDKTQFLLEVANNHILLGRSDDAKAALAEAAQMSGLTYALSGALGKRTRFQEKSTSQLVVLALSRGENQASNVELDEDQDTSVKPDALKLNDDTLLEDIEFTADSAHNDTKSSTIPSVLADLAPDNQPQLSPLDQVLLLTEATLRDSFSPADTLTAEEILPYATRVLADKSTNWQIYTQALLVRSRIELHRSRTVERGVLQLQAVADQVLTDTTEPPPAPAEEAHKDNVDVPSIEVTTPAEKVTRFAEEKPTSFLPAPKPTESAPAATRLRYIHSLSSPPRWHLESELAYAWAGVGSLTSALEIFKRLRLWAEVALCLASAAAAGDEDGRNSAGEEKARGIIRWRLFNRTGSEQSIADADEETIDDVTSLRSKDFSGPERRPPPPNAARLWCILGDLEEDTSHYERAWEVSNQRYSRAQKSLGEYYLVKQKDINKAREAYKKATTANRLSPELWSRLGDISLRMGDFEEAAEAYSRCIGSATDTAGGEDARTWSNLGSSLWSLYLETVAAAPNGQPSVPQEKVQPADDEEDFSGENLEAVSSRDPSKLLARSLAAYKRGASIAHDNWRIWDNVLTLCTRIQPTPVVDIVVALKHIIRIRKTEDALDVDLLSALLRDHVLSKEKSASGSGVYEPPRGSNERLITRLLEEEAVPLITHRADLWTLMSRLRAWRNDHAGAVEASTNAWRCVTGSSNSGLMPNSSTDASADWTTDKSAWDDVVRKTDELASMLENWGPSVETIGTKWKGRVRSAVRTVMGRGRESWEGDDGWKTLEGILEGLKKE